MIKIRWCREEVSLDIKGHAGAGEPGKDLVCCAVSTLAQCLLNNMESLVGGIVKKVEATVEPGDLYIRIVPCEYRRITVLTIYDAYINGLQYVSQNNPEFIEMEEV